METRSRSRSVALLQTGYSSELLCLKRHRCSAEPSSGFLAAKLRGNEEMFKSKGTSSLVMYRSFSSSLGPHSLAGSLTRKLDGHHM